MGFGRAQHTQLNTLLKYSRCYTMTMITCPTKQTHTVMVCELNSDECTHNIRVYQSLCVFVHEQQTISGARALCARVCRARTNTHIQKNKLCLFTYHTHTHCVQTQHTHTSHELKYEWTQNWSSVAFTRLLKWIKVKLTVMMFESSRSTNTNTH